MKYFFLILVLISCRYSLPTRETSKERTVIVGPYIELKPNGNSMVITTYSDSSMTIVNLNKDGELLDSTFIKK